MIVAIIIVIVIGTPWATNLVLAFFDTNDRVRRIEKMLEERGKK